MGVEPIQANRGGGTFDRGRLIGAGLALYVAWVGSTAVGALGAGFLGDPTTLGLDAAFPALFLALSCGLRSGTERPWPRWCSAQPSPCRWCR